MLDIVYKKINKGIKAQGKEKLINFMKPITNGLAKVHIDLRKKVYKQIIDNLGGKIRLVIHGGAPADKATIVGLNSFWNFNNSRLWANRNISCYICRSRLQKKPRCCWISYDK